MAVLQLCHMNDVLNYTGKANVGYEDKNLVERLIAGFSKRAEMLTNRLFYRESRTQDFSPDINQTIIQLPAFGNTSDTITSVYEDLDREWTPGTLIDSADYFYDTDTGLLVRDHSYWQHGRNVIRVTWTGGFGTTVDDVPDDLRMAAIMQCAFWYQRRNELGVTQRTSSGGAVSLTSPSKLLPEVEDVVSLYTLYTFDGGIKGGRRY
jgi:hypothetical protein